MDSRSQYKKDVNWNRKSNYIPEPTDPNIVFKAVCSNCNSYMNEEVISGPGEPKEVLYECKKCGRKLLERDGLNLEVLEDGK